MTAAEELPLASPAATLGGIVAARPHVASLFEQLGLDYCCGGQKTLEQSCRERGLDAATVGALLEALETAASGRSVEHDVGGLSIAELSEHIVSQHHEPLGPQMERIDELLVKVTRAHGAEDPGTHVLRQYFTALEADLSRHMRLEEDELFPACRALEREDDGRPPGGELLERLEDTHEETGAALAELRELANDYRPESAHCTTHRVLLNELSAFERELHQHIHEENNVLFPKVRGLIRAMPTIAPTPGRSPRAATPRATATTGAI